jgi:hypothetical protein
MRRRAVVCWEKDRKLVGGEPCQQIVRGNRFLQTRRDLLQQRIGLPNAEPILQLAKSIHVHRHQREAALRRLSGSDGLLDPVAQLDAVGKSGQRIEIRELLERVLFLPELQRE